jgi:hypothetical protein
VLTCQRGLQRTARAATDVLERNSAAEPLGGHLDGGERADDIPVHAQALEAGLGDRLVGDGLVSGIVARDQHAQSELGARVRTRTHKIWQLSTRSSWAGMRART